MNKWMIEATWQHEAKIFQNIKAYDGNADDDDNDDNDDDV